MREKRCACGVLLLVILGGCVAGGGDDGADPTSSDSTSSDSTSAALAGCTGISVSPSDAPNLPAIVSSKPAGTTFCLQAGTYRIPDSLRPRDNDIFIGAGSGSGGTEIRGDHVVAGWSSSGGLYKHTGGVAKQFDDDPCADGTDTCKYGDDLFKGGAPLRRVLSPCTAKNVVTGTFCIDYGANTMYVADDPSGAVLSYASLQSGIKSATGLVVKHIALTHFANVPRGGAPLALGDNGMVDDVVAAFNHAAGIKVNGNYITIQNSHLHHNGQVGASGNGIGLLFANNEVNDNNTAHYDASWAAGGAKFVNSTNFRITNNYFHDNLGTGLWFDVDNTGEVIDGNRSENNRSLSGAGDGIRIEITCNGAITNNTLSGNARAGMTLANSYNMVVGGKGTGNIVKNNASVGIEIQGSGRVETGRMLCNPNGTTYPVTDNKVTYNQFTMTAGSHNGLAAVDGVEFTGSHFGHNTYLMVGDNCASGAWKWREASGNATLSFIGFQNDGQDVYGTCSSK